MASEFEVKDATSRHPIFIDPVGFISEIMNNIGDQRDIIRELISNAAAKEVKAKTIEIRIYESEKGLAITVSDDGIGMDYTGNQNKPGRLDKFLNAAQGRQAGFESDEFGAKGLGTKLLYNSDRAEVETWDGGENWYRVVMDEPRKTILEHKQLCVPIVHTIPARPPPKRGTAVTVKGWSGQQTLTRDFRIDRIERFLRYYTVVGYTGVSDRVSSFPEFSAYVGGQKISMKVGFPYITSDNASEDSGTVIFEPIEIKKETDSGKPIKIVLKGGITTDTGKNNLTEDTGGIWLSVNGIPYFKLQTNKYSRKLFLTDDFIRFVVECDDVRLNMSRSDFGYDEYYEAFENALNDAFSIIRDNKRFQKFYQNRRRQLRIKTQDFMNMKKDEFTSKDKRFVWYKGRMLLAEPEREYDTAALLWILEGSCALPFSKFRTLQYPGYREGVDLLVTYQEEKDKEEHVFVYAELERLFSNFMRHGHEAGQMSLAFCWRLDKGKISVGNVMKTSKPYKYIYNLGDSSIPVFEISSFPGIFVGTKEEADEYFKTNK